MMAASARPGVTLSVTSDSTATRSELVTTLLKRVVGILIFGEPPHVRDQTVQLPWRQHDRDYYGSIANTVSPIRRMSALG
jgi:hypothetical protein